MRRLYTIGVFATLLGTVFLLPGTSVAYETDQYTHRFEPLGDALEVLDREVNEALAAIAADWRDGVYPARFATQLYRKIGGRHWVDKLERFAIRSPEIERMDIPLHDSIYGPVPFWATPVISVVGVGKTIRIDGTLVGTDKIGHFLSQGWKYHKRHLRGLPEEEVVRLGVRNEKGIFGAASTGVFSNADLVANYEGYLFYRSLFEDDVVPGKPAIVRFVGAGAEIQRPFTWGDHVNDYWDEALNPNRFGNRLGKHISRNLEARCRDYQRRPAEFVSATDRELGERYAHLGLRDAPGYRLDRVCGDLVSSVR